MGSSVSGSLDKFAPISPAAALVSGKVKLPGGPMGGIAGMLQEDMIGRAEAKQAQNAANMAMMQQQQDQQDQYNMALQQMMMGQQQRPSLYSPAPYADGGNVALRRKMFKLGGSASAHGTGLTSGLSFNQGGAVEQPRQNFQVGGIAAGARLLNFLKNFVTKPKPNVDEIARFRSLTGTPTSIQSGIFSTAPGFGTKLARVGALATPPAVASGLLGEAPDPFTEEEQSPAMRALDALRMGAEFVSDVNPLTLAATAALQTPKLFDPTTKMEDLDFTIGEALRTARGVEREKTPEELVNEDQIDPGITVAELSELASKRQREDLEAAMAMYQDLIRGEDNTNKLATLGDAAIAAGSALMAGEGYGGAAAAFNQPLAQARAAQQEADQAARGAAAQLAIGEDIARRQQDEALFAELAATGQFDTAEEISQVVTARKFGISRVLPEDDKGEVDTDALSTAGAGVYVDPKTRYGTVFIAVNSATPPETKATNDPEVAKQFAKS